MNADSIWTRLLEDFAALIVAKPDAPDDPCDYCAEADAPPCEVCK
jgi:hypothetical protein